MKKCNKCYNEKSIDNFRRNRGTCKECENKLSKLYKENNKEHIKEQRKNYRSMNKEKIKKYNNKYNKIFRKRNRATTTGRLKHKIQVLIRKSFKLSNINKNSIRTHEILGCSFNEFKSY